MIFAPRSWPSRPGLATTTRIFDGEDTGDRAGSYLPAGCLGRPGD
jgi:hypothetical protein